MTASCEVISENTNAAAVLTERSKTYFEVCLVNFFNMFNMYVLKFFQLEEFSKKVCVFPWDQIDNCSCKVFSLSNKLLFVYIKKA